MMRIADIQRAVAARYGITIADLKSDAQCVRLARPRQIAMHLARRMTKHSLPMIASQFGGRHHTTALHSCRKVAALRAANPDFNAEVRDVVRALRRGA